MKKTGNILFILFFLCFGISEAQELSASVNRSKVGLNENFQIDFSFTCEDVNGIRKFTPPVFSNFRILSGPNQSTSMQIINGKMNGSVSFSYIVQPVSLGEFGIGAAIVNYNGNNYASKPIKIQVVQGSTAPKSGQQDDGTVTEDLSKSVFILAEVDKRKVYQGEQVTVTYKLYTKLNINSPQISKLPNYEGFWQEEIETSNTINFDIVMYKGERFRSAKLKQVALFPTRTGTLSVTPFELNIPVMIQRKKQQRSNSVFDDFFNDPFFNRTETVQHTAKSNTLKIEVLPLPQNKPDSYNGAVGTFSIKAYTDKKDVKTNESINLKIEIEGTGNIKLLTLPDLILPNTVDKYEPKISESINRSGKINGKKIFEYLIVPRQSGEFKIPSIELSSFNPATAIYSTKKTDEISIHVEQGTGSYANSPAPNQKEDVSMLSKDIRYISNLIEEFEPIYKVDNIGNWFWILNTSFGVVFIGMLIYSKRKQKLYSNESLLKYYKAGKVAKERLKAAKKALDSKDENLFFFELSKVIYGYLEDKLAIDKSIFTLEYAAEKLRQRNFSENVIEKFLAIANYCETSRYSPVSKDMTTAEEYYKKAYDFILEVDSNLGLKK
ncbi:MAG: BatD family protein [Melioribacteraceae bacterium]|nr:BatD family protein [Melioribacteraceae bacterium]